MPATTEIIPAVFSPTSSASPRGDALSADIVPAVVQSSAAPIITPLQATTPSTFPTAQVPERREISLPVADASAVVREVAELTHDFRMRERSSVEVKFNFKDETELSVRLSYRDGDVHATFRTDSTELRAALTREWQGFAVGMAQEPRGYRIADPVFTASNGGSDFAQSRDSGSSAGGDARDQRQAPRPDQPDLPRSASPDRDFRPHVPALGHRVSSDHLLHALA